MAGQEGFEPPAPGFGVRCSIRLELLAPSFSFLMNGMLSAKPTILFQFNPIRVIPLVLLGGIISPFAFGTS